MFLINLIKKHRLEKYRNVKNLRILVCGGDGSVGWVMSEIDNLKFEEAPPVT